MPRVELDRQIELDGLWNPYDFANPVNDDSLFAGREGELADIRYYLRLASRAPRPINLVLTGPRSSGKTSILNKIAHEAEERGFCVARVDLNEADASPLSLFYKIYDAIIVAAVGDGAFAGFSGDVYARYRQIMDGGQLSEISSDDLLFPRHYAAAVNGSRILSEPTLKADLARISKEVAKPCVVLFDECDVLTKSRIELEMLRNVFMNTAGYMLALAGTPNLFPAIEEVFSPITRQFKKIPVEHLSDLDDTQACIEKPLKALGIEPADAIHPPDWQLYLDVHRLSAGRPYEVQLLCHFMFKRVEDGRTRQMAITVDVLDDVREELETQESGAGRPSIRALAQLAKTDLALLKILTAARGSIEAIWSRAALFEAEPPSLEALTSASERFVALGLLTESSGTLTFTGDQFDEVYARYYAASHNVRLQVSGWDISKALNLALLEFLSRLPGITPVGGLYGGETKPQLQEALVALMPDSRATILPDLTGSLYGPMLRSLEHGSMFLAEVVLECTGSRATTWVASAEPIDTLAAEQMSDLAERARGVGGALSASTFEVPLPSYRDLVLRVHRTASPNQLRQFAGRHSTRAFKLFETGHIDAALEQYATATSLHPTVRYTNSAAHMCLRLNDWIAAECFAVLGRAIAEEAALEEQDDLEQYAMASYDLAIAHIGLGRAGAAEALLHEVADILSLTGQVSGYLAVPTDDCAGPSIFEVRELGEAVTLTREYLMRCARR